MFGKKGSTILKLPPVRNCFTSAMTNKLVVVINSLKVPKIKKILLYEMEFLVPNYSCYDVMVNSEELIGATEYLTLQTRSRINRRHYNRVLQYNNLLDKEF